MLGLTIESGDRVVHHGLPDAGRVVLGSAAHCDVVVAGTGVRAEHARFERDGERVHVVALGGDDASDAGLVVNDERVARADLGSGDSLSVGDVRVRIESRDRTARLRGLDGFREFAADEARDALDAAPLVADHGRLRIVLDDLDDGLEALDGLPGAARPLRRLLEVSKRLARAGDEGEWTAALLDAALVLVGGDVAVLVGRYADGGAAALAARDAGGDAPLAAAALPDDVEEALADGGARLVLDDAGEAVGACAALGDDDERAVAVLYRHERGRLGTAELDVLRALADQATLGLEGVRLRENLARSEADLAEAGARAERLNRRLADLLQRRTLELRETRAELARRDAAEGFGNRFTDIVGRGPAMLEVLRQVDRVAPTTVPVLFEGESGTGKELLARALHVSSDRASEPFVAENCAALPDTLLENELFGHERGAFTGAETSAMGLFERADGGTLFLDEVGDMSPNLQMRLLRVLQEGEVRRVGGSTVTHVDVRVVTATNRNLLEMVREGTFREDLYYRLAVVKVRVPPLRERREDVPALVAHFLRLFSSDGLPVRATDEALDAILRHDWPGNIRELQNEVRRAAALSRGLIDVDSLSPEVRESRPALPDLLRDPVAHLDGRDLRALVDDLEQRVLRAVLEREDGNITRTAAALGLSRLGLRKKMQRFGLTRDEARNGGARRSQVHRT